MRLGLLLCLLVPVVAVAQSSGTDALPVSNGFAAAAWSPLRARLTAFYPHLYQQWSATSAPTPQLAFDAYLGIRLGGTAVWLPESPNGAGVAAYVHGGMVRATQQVGDATVETWLFSPQDLGAPVVLLVGHVVNAGSSTLSDNAWFSIQNFHLGAAGSADGESTRYLSARTAFVESGAAGAVAYAALGPPAVAVRSPDNPYGQVKSAGHLTSSGGGAVTQNDSVSGFEWPLPALSPGGEAWAGFAILPLAAGDDATANAALDGLRAWIAGRTPSELVAAAQSEWDAWLAKAQRPIDLSADERSVLDAQLAILRMGQVREPNGAGGVPHGQLVASMPPGQWNIAWPRDMAYATMALAAYGYLDEARAALDFYAAAAPRQGAYQSFVGAPYGVSACRYYGNGDEWSDVNADGPNVELDGFGLYLIAAKRAGVTPSAAMLQKVATPLESAIGSDGLIKADSSIWERHINGKERKFLYTSITAAAGLEAAGRHASALRIAEAVGKKVDGDLALCATAESCPSGSQRHDGSVVEALNFGVIGDSVAPGTLGAFSQFLKLSSGGYKRLDDSADWYDSQEWLFVDLRIATAGDRAAGDRATLLGKAHGGVIPELVSAADGVSVTGAMPMVGFGAGVYALWLADRGKKPVALYPPPVGGDGGVAPDGGQPSPDGGQPAVDGGEPPAPPPRGCGCAGSPGVLMLPLAAALFGARRRGRRLRKLIE
ncbi:MAG: glycoside hydrolase family 15 protein [Myxococcaceae bacterium]